MTDIIHSLCGVSEMAMQMAELAANMRSKDPKTKVGACAYDWSTGATYIGYNGFPACLPDKREWWEEYEDSQFNKHDLVIHAESAAMQKALRAGADMKHVELFVTHMPCLRCVVEHIIANKIKAITVHPVGPALKDLQRAKQILAYAGTLLYYYADRIQLQGPPKAQQGLHQ